MNRREFAVAAAGALVATPLLGAAQRPIKIGVIVPRTGNPVSAEQLLNGVILATEQLQAKGIATTLEVADTTADTANALPALETLLAKNVAGIVGPAQSNLVLALCPRMKTVTIPWMTGGVSETTTLQGVNTLFRVRASDAVATRAATAFIIEKLKYSKVAILYSDEAFGKGGVEQMSTRLLERSVDLVAAQSFAPNATDLEKPLTKIAAAKPQILVVYSQNVTTSPKIITAARQYCPGVDLFGFLALANRSAITLAGAEADKAYICVNIIPDGTSADERQFGTAYTNRFGTPPDYDSSGWSYDAVMLLADAFAKGAGNDQALARIRALTNRPGVLGSYTCNAAGELLHTVAIGQIENGTPRLIARITG